MSLKRKIFNFFAAVVMCFGALPMPFFNNSVNVYADGSGLDTPGHSKRLIDNGDGTYTIALSVTGSRESSETTSATKANVILVVDTSNSMNGSSGETSASGQPISRIAAEKDALTKDDGIVDKLLAQNVPGDSVKSDIIEVAVVNFGTEGHTAQTWTTNGTTLKNTINGLTTSTGTNWEGALQIAKNLADAKKQAQPNEDIYVIFLTDGEPTTDETRARNNHNVNMNYGEEWGYASDDARAIVSAGYTFYGLFTWGSSSNSSGYSQTPSAFLKSLVQYAYTGTGTYSSSLSSDYAEYYTDASSTTALINALNQIVHNITTGVGYTDVELEDGITAMTASSVKASASGKVTGLKYYRSGGPYSTTANNGLGEEWADAPEATINANNEVDWDLGDLILENGVAYTITFVVWPKQSSLDLVADLNNGIISYDDLTDSQKSQIKHIGDKYALKTNTDFPTLTYSTITTTTVDGVPTSVTSDPTTVEIGNPDPVDLSEAKLALEKKWEDSLDPTQREEVGGEVTLNLLMDGEPYEIKIGDTLTDEILLTETNDWKINPGISVAPGLMVTEDSVAYDPNAPQVSYGGVTYAILEAGHEYTFEEKDINNHFELTSYIHHPMKIGDTVKDVFFSRDADGDITGIERIEDLDTLSATNTLKGGINIEKKVVDQNGNTVDTDDSFKITAHLLDADGNRYAYDYRIYYGENNPCYATQCEGVSDSDFAKHRSGHIYGTGDLTETLYLGDVIRIVNTDSGVQYYVEETEKVGYAAAPKITYKEAYGTQAPVDSTKTKDGYYVVSGNTASSVTVTNTFLDEKTKVDFEKTWYDQDGNVLSGKTLPGSITVNLFKEDADSSKVAVDVDPVVLTADNSWKGSFTNLPKYDDGEEIVYSVQESEIEGATYNDELEAFFEFDPVENNGQHAVMGRWTWKPKTLEDIIIENTWKPATETVSGRTSFNIVKIDKNTKEPLSGATFELKLSDGTTFTATTGDDGKAVFNNLDAGEYTLRETDSPEGYKSISTEPNINITSIKKLNTVDLANLENIYEYVFSFSTSQVDGYEYDASSRTFTVENEPIPYDDIVVAKVWDDDNNRDGLRKNYANYYVAVKNNSGKYVNYKKLASANQDYTFEHLPKMTVDGEDITYEIVEASSCSGSGSSIECTEFTKDDDYIATVANGVITNKHVPELINEDDDDPDNDGKLTVQKVWDGEGNELVRPTTITIELYANGSRLGEPVTLSAVTGWKHTFEKLYKNENGEPIVYTVEESKLGETAFNEGESTIIIYMDDNETEKGQWDKAISGSDITNTWTRDTANSFKVKKTTVGLKAKVLKDIEFTVTGPEDFGEEGEMTLKIGKGCTVSGDYEITCTVDGKVPTGTYKVVEKNAEVENFTLVKDTGNNEEKKVKKNTDVVFEIKNEYEKIRDVHYKVAKVWDDDSDRDGKRPDGLEITLKRKGSGAVEDYRTVTLTDDKLSHEWTDLPRADESGAEYVYSVVEESVDDYESDGGEMVDGVFTFTNTHKPELINEDDDDPDNDGKLSVQKIWDGEGNELVKPETVTIELYAETTNDKGEVKTWMVGQPVEISEASDWAWTFTDLYKYDNGLEITYTVEESKIGGTAFDEGESVIVVYRDDAEIENGKWEKKISGTDITNTWTRSMAGSLMIKKTTVGLKAAVLKDIEFTVTGPEDFGEEGEMTLKIGKGCTVSGDYEITCMVEEVPTGVYTVSEKNADVENFTLVKDTGNNEKKEANSRADVVFEIENEYVVDEITYYVEKVWEDAHDKDGKRPEKLTVNLLANGEIIDTIELTMKDAYIIDENDQDYVTGDIWGSLWEGLPYADEDAEVITYTVEEVLESDDYEQLAVFGDEYASTFLNYHRPVDPCADGGCGGDVIPPAPDTGMMTGLFGSGLASTGWAGSVFGGIAIAILGAGLFCSRTTRKRSNS